MTFFFLLLIVVIHFITVGYGAFHNYSKFDVMELQETWMLWGVIPLAICVVLMNVYSIGRVLQLFTKKNLKDCIRGIFFVFVFNFASGYIWFYYSEIKGKRTVPFM